MHTNTKRHGSERSLFLWGMTTLDYKEIAGAPSYSLALYDIQTHSHTTKAYIFDAREMSKSKKSSLDLSLDDDSCFCTILNGEKREMEESEAF